MGVVWRVRDLQFKRPLALKVMQGESADSRRVGYFLREARITAQLAHPSIVAVHSMGRLADGRPYIAGELSAEELLDRAGRSQWDQCLAHYYIAMSKLAKGDREGAKEHFNKVIKTRAFFWGPYDMSWVFLSRLKDPTWPPWIPKRP
jgi:serine/threonine protein kinase